MKDDVHNHFTSDTIRTDEHEETTWDLILLVEHDPGLKRLLEKAISQAAHANPDRSTNPADSLDSFYRFLDWAVKAAPWEPFPKTEYLAFYQRIEQGMGMFYFICDQPLQKLADRGYYHNSLLYHEPFRSWVIKYVSTCGSYLNTEASWNEEYYALAREDKTMCLDEGLYEDPSNWHTFNEFFARRLRDPSCRPVAGPDDPSVVVFPADSLPMGVWDIDADNNVIMPEPEARRGIAIKTGTLRNVSALLGNSQYADAFAGGKLTHTFLDAYDYHRYHFPVTGTVKEVQMIPADDAPGGIVVWEEENKRYNLLFPDVYGWQSLETRGAVILETVNGGLAAVIPVGMCMVSSVNFENTVTEGAQVKKGDPLGHFMFGGSDIVMLFSKDAGFTMTAEAMVHGNMGNAYGILQG